MRILEPVPLLGIQRELYDLPRGMGRFRRYLQTMTGGTDDLVLPLVAFNPMGREHVAAALDELIELGAEAVAAEAVAEAELRLPDPGLVSPFRVGLVLADDVGGAWTHRQLTETRHRFEREPEVRRRWITVLLWTSEKPSAQKVRQAVLGDVYRAFHALRHGWPVTLRQALLQEGRAALFCGRSPRLEPDEIDRCRELIREHLDSDHFPTIFTCLYGDDAAAEVGYAPLGLPSRAGYAVAAADARAAGVGAAEAVR